MPTVATPSPSRASKKTASTDPAALPPPTAKWKRLLSESILMEWHKPHPISRARRINDGLFQASAQNDLPSKKRIVHLANNTRSHCLRHQTGLDV